MAARRSWSLSGSGSSSTSFVPSVTFFFFLGDMIFSLLMLKTYFCLLFFWWVGGLWLSGVAGSIAYNWSRPSMKTSVKIIHARYLFSILIIMFFSQNILEVLVRLAFICIY